MRFRSFRKFIVSIVVSLCALCAYPESGALLVVGLSGDNLIAAEHREMAERTSAALQERGIPQERIQVLNDRVVRNGILSALKDQLSTVEAGEEYWVVLLGHGGIGRGGEPQFQIRGPRFSASDLQEILKTYPEVRVNVILGFDRSGGFLSYMEGLNAEVVTATASVNEKSLPRFTGYLVDALEASPTAEVPLLAARAAKRTQSYYETNSLARNEESRLYDPVAGEILQPPFGVEDLQEEASPPVSTDGAPFQGVAVADIEIPSTNETELFTEFPATEETLAMIEEANAVPNPEGFPGIMLRRELELTVTPTLQSIYKERFRVYLSSSTAFDEWANYSYPMSPPGLTSRIEAVRVIHPDGRYRVMASPETAEQHSSRPSVNQLFIPGLEEGCIVELEVVIQSFARDDIPAFYEETQLQISLPTLWCTLNLNLPTQEGFHYHLANASAEPEVVERELETLYFWELKDLPAYEALPYDPPPREWTIWFGVSSIPTWEAFTEWFDRITQGAFDPNDEVIALAAEIAAEHEDPEARIQAAYEKVREMRYVAIEIGIQAFRPRTPGKVLKQGYGDCKDKANLLSALLREMEIPAHLALINRFSFTDETFPGWQFNHAIAYVQPSELYPEGLWLDATETTTPYGELAPGNAGRKALIMDLEGNGVFKVVHTRARTDKEEFWEMTRGEQAWRGAYTRPLDNELNTQLMWQSPAQRDLFLRGLAAPLSPRGDIQSVRVEKGSSPDSEGSVHAEVEMTDGSLPLPNVPWRNAFLAYERNRPLQLFESPTRLTQEILLPGTALEALPEPFHATVEEGRFACHVEWHRDELGQIVRSARVEVLEPILSAEAYPELRKAFLSWWDALHYNLPPRSIVAPRPHRLLLSFYIFNLNRETR